MAEVTNRFYLNCDCGEDVVSRDHDVQLLSYVNAVNIALGGHAGEAEWSRTLATQARQAGVDVILHPSYPDRAHFGRRVLDMPWSTLEKSLTDQRALLPDVYTVKFHGALYNQAMRDAALAKQLIAWCTSSAITKVVCMPDSCLEQAARAAHCAVIREGFADRRYTLEGDSLVLMPRDQAGAVLQTVDEVCAQVHGVHRDGGLHCDGQFIPIQVDSWCVHSDSPNSLALLQALRQREQEC